jgi:hypothetical protein
VWADSIRVRKEGVRSRTISVADASNFETRYVIERKQGNRALAGLGIGVLVGGAPGFAVGDDKPGSFFSFSARDYAKIFGVLFGVIGTGVGIGSAETRYSPWTPVTFPQDTIRVKL